MDKIESILDSASALYSFDTTQLKPLHGGHISQVYGFNQETRSYVLRITPPNDEITLPEMKAILEWMQYLAQHGAAVPSPIRSTNNNLIEIIYHKGQTYLAGVIEAAKGTLSEEVQIEQWNEELYQILGVTIGKIHTLATQYNPSNPTLKRPVWDDIPNNFNPENNDDPSLVTIVSKKEEVLDHLARLPKGKDCFGLIHGDLHFGNFFMDIPNKEITIFDFDDCVYGWYLMDIATLLFDILVVYQGANKEELASNFLLNLLRGYTREKSFSLFWINQMPYFLKLLEIGIYIQVYQDYDASENVSWIGKFMNERQKRIENDIPYVELDFGEIFRSM
jgi:Ser/Thr protein kinase RdoA (MazF antagonist)